MASYYTANGTKFMEVSAQGDVTILLSKEQIQREIDSKSPNAVRATYGLAMLYVAKEILRLRGKI